MPRPEFAPGGLPRGGGLLPAPFHADVAEALPEAQAWWTRTPRGVRLRVARLGTGPRGTVLLLPGRTEFVEKYGPTARALAERGYGTACIDWRGQGLADRPLPDPATGHVSRFDEYQEDLGALVAALTDMGLSGPRLMLAHSMGGAIGLRALAEGSLSVGAVVFTGPMWGIALPPLLRPLAGTIVALSRPLGLSTRYAPGTAAESYVGTADFADNQLTTDPERFAFLRRQVQAHPELSLGGPSIAWVGAALDEIAALRRLPSPALPCLTVLGALERIIDSAAVRDRMARWPGGRLEVVPGARHEVLMETPERRQALIASACALFDAAL